MFGLFLNFYMKKIFTFISFFILILSIFSCSKNENKGQVYYNENGERLLTQPQVLTIKHDQNQELKTKSVTIEGNETLDKFVIKDQDNNQVGEIITEGPYDAAVYKITDKYIFIGLTRNGIGGYILYAGVHQLYQLDRANNNLKKVNVPDNGYALTDVSTDGNLVAYVDENVNNHSVNVLNITDDSVKTFKVLEKYGQAGDVKFSPDGKKIAYAASLGSPDSTDWESAIYAINLETSEEKLLITQKVEVLHVIGWKDNDNVDYNGGEME